MSDDDWSERQTITPMVIPDHTVPAPGRAKFDQVWDLPSGHIRLVVEAHDMTSAQWVGLAGVIKKIEDYLK